MTGRMLGPLVAGHGDGGLEGGDTRERLSRMDLVALSLLTLSCTDIRYCQPSVVYFAQRCVFDCIACRQQRALPAK
jgi:hypothetical protein